MLSPNHPPLHSRRTRAFLLGALAAFSTLWAGAAHAKTVLVKAGGEQQINLLTFGDQTSPAIAADSQGGYAVAWLGPDERFLPHLFVRLFDAGGSPRSGEIVVDTEAAPFEEPRRPRVAMAPDGRFVVLWSSVHAWARLYDAQGHALGARLRTDDVSLFSGTSADLAIRPDGSFLVTWIGVATSSGIYARSFGAAGQPQEAGRKLDVNPPAFVQAEPHALTLAGGDSLVFWTRQKAVSLLQYDSQMVAARRSVSGGPWSAEIELLSLPEGQILWPSSLGLPEGGFSVVCVVLPDHFPPSFPEPKLFGRRFDAEGRAATALRLLPFSSQFEGAPAAAADRYGNSLVVVPYNFEQKTTGRLFDRDWNPVGTETQVVTFEDDFQNKPAVTAAGDGFVAAWESGSNIPFPFPIPPFGQDGHGFGIFAQRFGPPPCVEGSKVLCLGADGRFELSVDWKVPLGTEGEGRAHPLTGDSGAFWFFQPSNLELLTKVLDGRPVNDHFWVFSGALSNVEYTLKVHDSETGEDRTYPNPQGTLASRADTEAFRGEGPAPAPAVASSFAELSPVPGCGPQSPTTLCFDVRRGFEVSVDFVDPRTGLHGTGQAVPLTENSGAFTFFDAANLELVVKVLDGGAVNGKVWFFYGALSDVAYTITVRDRLTETVRTYSNTLGQLASRADTSAFDAGPGPF